MIVPVYNTEKYLAKCLDSLVNQSLDDIEIIAIDDGATDKSGEILDRYAELYPSKVVVRHKENGGQASARNMALRLCTGEYIGFLDSDDYVKSDMFQKLYEKAKNCNADYVGCAYTDLLEQKNTNVVLKEYVGNKPCTTNREMFLGGAKVSPFINFYKRELITDNDIFFPEGMIYEDTGFWAKIVPFIKKPVYVQEALACRVRHDNSTTTITKPEKVGQIFTVLKDLIDYYQSNKLYEGFYEELEYFCVRILLCSSLERISKVSDKKERNQLLDETFSFLRTNFFSYKKNKYLKNGKTEKYIILSNKPLCKFIVFLLRIKKK